MSTSQSALSAATRDSGPDSFACFQRLPVDIRIQIWATAAHEPRSVDIWVCTSQKISDDGKFNNIATYHFATSQPPPSIHLCPLNPSLIELTASAVLKFSKTTNDPEVQASMLDILLIPGPDPSTVLDGKVLDFVRAHAGWRGKDGKMTDILSVCTGCIVLAQSGLLKGRCASGPRAIVPKLRKDFPQAKWDDNKRWVKDGNIWGSGGITNGQEMVAAYMREKLPSPATEAVIAMADVGDKGIDYPNGKTKETTWWLWQILKAWAMGGKQKKV